MIVKRMTATFGRLERATLELGDGLNIIEAPNEGGKSTWAGFMRAMLYGIPTRERDKRGYLAEKNRYQPWSGAPMEGEIDLVWQGREITLRRFPKGGVPFGGFSAVYTGTNEPVPGLTASSCGQALLGVGREVYERSAFVGQSAPLAIDSAPELERRIAALFSSGEEDVSFSQTESRLREWQRRRKHNRSGLIPRLEEELDAVSGTLAHMEEINARTAAAQGRRKELERARQLLEGELQIHSRLAQHDLNGRYAQAQEEWQSARQELEQLEREMKGYGDLPSPEVLLQTQERFQYVKALDEGVRRAERTMEEAQDAAIQTGSAMKTSLFAGLNGEQARRQADEDIDSYHAAKNGRKRKYFLAFTALFTAFALLVMSILGLLPTPLFRIVAMIFAVAAVYFLNKGRRSEEQAKRILSRYRVSDPGGISELLDDYTVCLTIFEEKQEHLVQLRTAVEESTARRDRCREELLSCVHSFAPDASTLFGCSAALSRAIGLKQRLEEVRRREELAHRRYDDLRVQGGRDHDTLELLEPPVRTRRETEQALDQVREELARVSGRLSMAKGELTSLGSPAALDARREELERELERRRLEYDALTLALEGLEEANARLQGRFAPDLGRLSGEILSALTGGRYHTVALDREFDAAAAGPDGPIPRKTLELSRGTADQIYLAVRLAVCRLCLPEEDPAPLVLDDALAAFDDARMALALDCLAGLGRQILLFTCQSREGRWADTQRDVTRVRLGNAE